MPEKITAAELRRLVTERAYGCCEYCMSQQRFASHHFSLEHVFPISKGGTDDPANLALACQGCNNFKYTKTHAADPESGEVVGLFNPRMDDWKMHFRWNENFTVVIGATPSGRATVEALQLNREFLLNQRVVYRAFGVHPPEHSTGN